MSIIGVNAPGHKSPAQRDKRNVPLELWSEAQSGRQVAIRIIRAGRIETPVPAR